jgi:chromosome segregation ATPase
MSNVQTRKQAKVSKQIITRDEADHLLREGVKVNFTSLSQEKAKEENNNKKPNKKEKEKENKNRNPFKSTNSEDDDDEEKKKDDDEDKEEDDEDEEKEENNEAEREHSADIDLTPVQPYDSVFDGVSSASDSPMEMDSPVTVVHVSEQGWENSEDREGGVHRSGGDTGDSGSRGRGVGRGRRVSRGRGGGGGGGGGGDRTGNGNVDENGFPLYYLANESNVEKLHPRVYLVKMGNGKTYYPINLERFQSAFGTHTRGEFQYIRSDQPIKQKYCGSYVPVMDLIAMSRLLDFGGSAVAQSLGLSAVEENLYKQPRAYRELGSGLACLTTGKYVGQMMSGGGGGGEDGDDGDRGGRRRRGRGGSGGGDRRGSGQGGGQGGGRGGGRGEDRPDDDGKADDNDDDNDGEADNDDDDDNNRDENDSTRDEQNSSPNLPAITNITTRYNASDVVVPQRKNNKTGKTKNTRKRTNEDSTGSETNKGIGVPDEQDSYTSEEDIQLPEDSKTPKTVKKLNTGSEGGGLLSTVLSKCSAIPEKTLGNAINKYEEDLRALFYIWNKQRIERYTKISQVPQTSVNTQSQSLNDIYAQITDFHSSVKQLQSGVIKVYNVLHEYNKPFVMEFQSPPCSLADELSDTATLQSSSDTRKNTNTDFSVQTFEKVLKMQWSKVGEYFMKILRETIDSAFKLWIPTPSLEVIATLLSHAMADIKEPTRESNDVPVGHTDEPMDLSDSGKIKPIPQKRDRDDDDELPKSNDKRANNPNVDDISQHTQSSQEDSSDSGSTDTVQNFSVNSTPSEANRRANSIPLADNQRVKDLEEKIQKLEEKIQNHVISSTLKETEIEELKSENKALIKKVENYRNKEEEEEAKEDEQQNDSESLLEELHTKISGLKKEMADLAEKKEKAEEEHKNKLEKLKTKNKNLEEEKEELDTKIKQLEDNLKALKTRCSALDTQTTVLQAEQTKPSRKHALDDEEKDGSDNYEEDKEDTENIKKRGVAAEKEGAVNENVVEGQTGSFRPLKTIEQYIADIVNLEEQLSAAKNTISECREELAVAQEIKKASEKMDTSIEKAMDTNSSDAAVQTEQLTKQAMPRIKKNVKKKRNEEIQESREAMSVDTPGADTEEPDSAQDNTQPQYSSVRRKKHNKSEHISDYKDLDARFNNLSALYNTLQSKHTTAAGQYKELQKSNDALVKLNALLRNELQTCKEHNVNLVVSIAETVSSKESYQTSYDACTEALEKSKLSLKECEDKNRKLEEDKQTLEENKQTLEEDKKTLEEEKRKLKDIVGTHADHDIEWQTAIATCKREKINIQNTLKETKEKFDLTKQNLQEAKQELEKAKQELEKAKQELEKAKKDLENEKIQTSKITERNTTLQSDLTKLQSTCARLKDEKNNITTENDSNQKTSKKCLLELEQIKDESEQKDRDILKLTDAKIKLQEEVEQLKQNAQDTDNAEIKKLKLNKNLRDTEILQLQKRQTLIEKELLSSQTKITELEGTINEMSIIAIEKTESDALAIYNCQKELQKLQQQATHNKLKKPKKTKKPRRKGEEAVEEGAKGVEKGTEVVESRAEVVESRAAVVENREEVLESREEVLESREESRKRKEKLSENQREKIIEEQKKPRFVYNPFENEKEVNSEDFVLIENRNDEID